MNDVTREATSTAGRAERWARVKAVFLGALEHPADARPAYVMTACGDDITLRHEVESLLASDKAAEHFWETPAAGMLGLGALAGDELPPRFEPGTRVGAYEISGFIAAGGMGEVYRARHTVLNRPVAIKTVSARARDDPTKRRLIREAQHASTLTHPNICTIFEVGEADGIPFIVMEFVDGRPLGELVRRAPPPIAQLLLHGVQIADALAHAHERGIVHRDLKSSNVVVNSAGRPIVLDFGLAKRLPDATPLEPCDPTVTGPGALAGTLSHMAPEVLLGGRSDVRSDVWSLGVMLYELATGELPFRGNTPYEISSEILGAAPRAMSRHVPLALRLVIERCLIKNPDTRYQRASDVRDALDAIRRRRAWPLIGRLLVSVRRRTIAAAAAVVPLVVVARLAGDLLLERVGASPVRISTLAFLPLENATGNPGAAHYADGLTEALIGQLGSTANVRVISPISAALVARTAQNPAEVAKRLGADAIVTGRVRRVSERVAVDVRLVDASSRRVIWSDSYERNTAQVLALQADVVRGLAVGVRLAVRTDATDRLAVVRAVNPEAYEAYLKGRYEWNRRTQASLETAIAHFQTAIELDPTYAPAHAALADCYNQLGTVMLGTGSPREFRPRAAAAAIRALQIDPYSAEAHAALGYVHHYNWRWVEAERELKRAIELNPNAPLPRIWYANLLMSRERMPEALEQVYVARDLDPFSLIVNSNVGWVLDYAGRREEAIAHLERTLALDSTYVQARWRLAQALAGAGRHEEAYDQAKRLVTLADSAPPTMAFLAGASMHVGRVDETRALLAELLGRARTEYVSPASIAGVYAALGDVERQLEWTTRAFEERSNSIAYARFESGVWTRDRRFRALVEAAGLQ